MTSKWLAGEWADESYIEYKKNNFEILDKVLESPPVSILDIGCGLAWESRMFNEKYGTELYLIDGDSSDNKNKSKKSSEINYHESSDSMLFYHTLDLLRQELVAKGTKNFTLVDCNNINIHDDKKFDVITSWLSCGFHYPISTYKDLIVKHCHEKTRIFLDIRVHLKTKEILNPENDVKIIQILSRHAKHINAEIKFL